MLPFRLIYHDQYYLPIGNHIFPADKYRRVHGQLIHSAVADESDFLRPQPASDEDILLVHTPAYVHKLKTGTLSPREELEMEIPYSEELVAAFWLRLEDRSWQPSTPSKMASRSTSGVAFTMHFLITAKDSA
jgi:acetoin utilization deacetylase AcuC-like enzyme